MPLKFELLVQKKKCYKCFCRLKCDLNSSLQLASMFFTTFNCLKANNIHLVLDICVFPEPYHKGANTVKFALRVPVLDEKP